MQVSSMDVIPVVQWSGKTYLLMHFLLGFGLLNLVDIVYEFIWLSQCFFTLIISGPRFSSVKPLCTMQFGQSFFLTIAKMFPFEFFDDLVMCHSLDVKDRDLEIYCYGVLIRLKIISELKKFPDSLLVHCNRSLGNEGYTLILIT